MSKTHKVLRTNLAHARFQLGRDRVRVRAHVRREALEHELRGGTARCEPEGEVAPILESCCLLVVAPLDLDVAPGFGEVM